MPWNHIVTFTVPPAWYQTWWFVLLCALFIASALAYFVLQAIRRKEEKMVLALKEHKQQVYEEKVRFLININHELRTPLTLISAPLSQILQKLSPDDVLYPPLKNVLKQAKRMKSLLNMVLSLRKMEMKETKLQMKPHLLNEWLKETADETMNRVNEVMGSFSASLEEFTARGNEIVTGTDNFNKVVKKQIELLEIGAKQAGGELAEIEKRYREMKVENFLKNATSIIEKLETLAVEPGLKDKPGAEKLTAAKAEIRFDNVSFAYAGREPLFENMNLTIKAGEKVGLVGHSGSGKSTFIKLIARYYDTTAGCITINGVDVSTVTQDSLHRLISSIPQDVCLFNRTLFDNIRYGRTNATEEEVYRAARQAGADEFIRAFPGGYQTKVGDRGVVLSGGERQRIAIARAILKNAPILVFDEATSALDSQSEKHIQKSLTRLMKNKTVIAIAHRLSTLREMDRILVFDKGRIVEQGTHLSLLRKKGLYYRLYNMQADGFIKSAEAKPQNRN